jgi:hypothetical protein
MGRGLVRLGPVATLPCKNPRLRSRQRRAAEAGGEHSRPYEQPRLCSRSGRGVSLPRKGALALSIKRFIASWRNDYGPH